MAAPATGRPVIGTVVAPRCPTPTPAGFTVVHWQLSMAQKHPGFKKHNCAYKW